MARRIEEGLPVTISTQVKRNQLWQTVEGMRNIGVYTFLLTVPPLPEPDSPTLINGEHAELMLPSPKQRHGKTATTIMQRLASKGGPFSYSDLRAAMAKAGKKGGPGNILRDAMVRGELKRIGAGQYVATARAADVASKDESIIEITRKLLEKAYPKPLATLEMRTALRAAGRRPETVSVSLNWLRQKKLAKRVGAGKWKYNPPKGAKQ